MVVVVYFGDMIEGSEIWSRREELWNQNEKKEALLSQKKSSVESLNPFKITQIGLDVFRRFFV